MSLLHGQLLWLYLVALIPIYSYYQKEQDIKHKRKILLLSFVLFLIVLAFSRPVLSQRLGDVTSLGTEIVIGVDLSASMQATDIEPSRADKASELLHQLVSSSKQDKFAVLGFTSSTIILSTMTDDKTLLFELFGRLNRNNIVSKSTKLHSVFELANQLSLLDTKQLVLFTDGSEGNLAAESEFARENNIRVYCVGIATASGSSLYDKSGEIIVDTKGDIVISSLNDELKQLSQATGGKFFSYEDDMSDILETIHEDAQMQIGHAQEITYIELFYFPLLMAIILFMIASTSMLGRYIAVMALLLPLHDAKAGVLDFYHISSASKEYQAKDYNQSAYNFQALGDKSWQSLLNTGTAFYKAENYPKARAYFLRIKTKDRALKARLFYNIANSYAKEYYFKKARAYYRKSLRLQESKESLENLLTVAFLEDKKEMLTGQQEAQAKDEAQEQSMSASESKSRSKSSKQQSSSSTSGAGKSKAKNESKKSLPSRKKVKVGLSSKQYEMINKGSYNEQNPW